MREIYIHPKPDQRFLFCRGDVGTCPCRAAVTRQIKQEWQGVSLSLGEVIGPLGWSPTAWLSFL